MGVLGLHTLKSAFNSITRKKRVGRGEGSARGNKCGKGSNGNQQRSGYKRKWGFEGGQTPMTKRFPIIHRINNFRRFKPVTVTIDMLKPLFEKNINEINKKVLVENHIIGERDNYKIVLGKKNEIPEKLTITANGFSKTVKNLIEKKEGKCIIL